MAIRPWFGGTIAIVPYVGAADDSGHNLNTYSGLLNWM